jgi:hypothetical protein
VAQLSDSLVEAIAAIVKAALEAGLFEDDPMWPTVVRPGLLQENPLSNKVSATVHLGDPDEVADSWVDETADRDDPYIPYTPMFEIGGTVGGMFWWRKGCVKCELFWIKDQLDRDEARERANVIKGKIERALMTRSQDIIGLQDTYGETVIAFLPVKSAAREGGGPNQLIWRVKVWWQALTAR